MKPNTKKPFLLISRSAIEEMRRKYSKDQLEKGVGGLDEGINRQLLNLKYHRYKNLVHDRVKSGWAAPPEISDRYLEVYAGIVIDDGGNVIFAEIEESSGNMYFDQSVLRAIRKASPLPLPPDFRGDRHELGFRFNNSEL